MRIGALLSTDESSKNSIPSSAGVLGAVGSVATLELRSIDGGGMRSDLRFAMEDEENGELQVEHFFSLWELAVSDLRHPPISGNRWTVRGTEERGLIDIPHLSEDCR